MVYSIIISPRAQKEIENAVDYYALYSVNAPAKFINALNDAYRTIALNPFFKLRYKNTRAYKIDKFPYILFFAINEGQMVVRVLSCFHNKRNPDKRP